MAWLIEQSPRKCHWIRRPRRSLAQFCYTCDLLFKLFLILHLIHNKLSEQPIAVSLQEGVTCVKQALRSVARFIENKEQCASVDETSKWEKGNWWLNGTENVIQDDEDICEISDTEDDGDYHDAVVDECDDKLPTLDPPEERCAQNTSCCHPLPPDEFINLVTRYRQLAREVAHCPTNSTSFSDPPRSGQEMCEHPPISADKKIVAGNLDKADSVKSENKRPDDMEGLVEHDVETNLKALKAAICLNDQPPKVLFSNISQPENTESSKFCGSTASEDKSRNLAILVLLIMNVLWYCLPISPQILPPTGQLDSDFTHTEVSHSAADLETNVEDEVPALQAPATDFHLDVQLHHPCHPPSHNFDNHQLASEETPIVFNHPTQPVIVPQAVGEQGTPITYEEDNRITETPERGEENRNAETPWNNRGFSPQETRVQVTTTAVQEERRDVEAPWDDQAFSPQETRVQVTTTAVQEGNGNEEVPWNNQGLSPQEAGGRAFFVSDDEDDEHGWQEHAVADEARY